MKKGEAASVCEGRLSNESALLAASSWNVQDIDAIKPVSRLFETTLDGSGSP